MKSAPTRLWRRAEAAFEALVDLPPGQQEALLAELRDEDIELAETVRQFLVVDSSAAPEPEATAGSVTGGPEVEGYRLLEPLGRGGMGTVYLAERQLGEVRTRVALKVLEGEPGDQALRLLRRESRILARLEHPTIARFLDAGLTRDGRPYLAMEHVEGLPIDVHCDQRRLDLRRRLELFLQVCEGVQYAHQNLVIHRDLKPGHILVTDDGRVKLLDFGIAKDLQSGWGARTTTAQRLLTPRYASPEQLAGQPASTASDLYALGLILSQLLCGRLPHRPEERIALTRQGAPLPEPEPPSRLLSSGVSLTGDPGPEGLAEARGTSLSSLRRRLRGDLDTLVRRCLAPEPRHRFASVAQLADDLGRHLDGRPVLARPPSLHYRLAKFVRRRPGVATAAGLLVAALVGYQALALRHSRELTRERDAALRARQEAEEAADFLADTFRLADAVQRVDLVGADVGEITVTAALDYGAARLGERFGDSPKLQAQLLDTLGETYTNLGRVEKAMPLLERSLLLRRALAPPDAAAMAETLGHLGDAYSAAGRLERAEAYLRQALVTASSARPPLADAALGDLLANLGEVLVLRHDHDRAEAAIRRALVLRRRSRATAPRPVAESLADLGNLLWQRGDRGEAEASLSEALEIYQDFAGGRHPGAAYALQTLAFLQAGERQTDAARTSIRRALALRRELQGPLHPETLETLAAAGELYFVLRDFPAAEEVLREVLAADRKVKGDRHPDVALDLHSISLAILEQGRAKEAQTFVEAALDISREVWGEESHAFTSHQMTLAKVLLARGRPRQAEEVLRHVLAFREGFLPTGNRLIALTEVLLASALEAQGKATEALPRIRRAVEVLAASEHPSGGRQAQARAVLGSCLAATGSPAEGRLMLEEALAVLEPLYGADSLAAQDVRQRLARLPSNT
ncbi:MAG: tetratricopeptide repeat protein [Acidobacteria bacterium]|nr:tetratricopeptide repeat protein [Acidobacteriota bacterium]